jgi:hypothetical protein
MQSYVIPPVGHFLQSQHQCLRSQNTVGALAFQVRCPLRHLHFGDLLAQFESNLAHLKYDDALRRDHHPY